MSMICLDGMRSDPLLLFKDFGDLSVYYINMFTLTWDRTELFNDYISWDLQFYSKVITNEEALANIYKLGVRPYVSWHYFKYDLRYYLNDGEMKEHSFTSYTKEETPILLEIPTREGYDFGGWFNNENFSGRSTKELSKGSYGDKNFYAKWIAKKYEIYFEVNDGDFLERIEYEYGKIPVIPTPVREGYQFDGWYLDSNFKQKTSFVTSFETGFNQERFGVSIHFGFRNVSDSNYTFYAKWKPAKCK